ncbi:glycosyltransferase family 2 protein [Lysobacter sp. CA199]|uniref:glycosyltransferase family 2 protein n=1 Tax=Lysobacter sp. CA199 TaxID=3455608 RepID=UPI003F8D4686
MTEPTGQAATPRATVVLCTYNGARYLPQQLDSLLAQSRVPDRIIAVDDVSGDDTWTLLETFAVRARAAGVEVELHRNQRNLGYLRNFEAALPRADAGIVFLCDQDDVWHRNKLEEFLQRFRSRPELLLLHSDSQLIDDEGRELGQRMFQTLEVTASELTDLHSGRGFDVLLRRNIVTGATTAIRRELLDMALPIPDTAVEGLPHSGWVHDEWLALVAAATGGVDCIETPSIGYRQHGANQIGARRRSLVERLGGGRHRRDHMRAMVVKLQSLRDRIDREGLAVPADRRAAIAARIAHLSLRLNLPRGLIARARLVREEWRQGRYHRYSAGLRSLLSDLLGQR